MKNALLEAESLSRGVIERMQLAFLTASEQPGFVKGLKSMVQTPEDVVVIQDIGKGQKVYVEKRSVVMGSLKDPRYAVVEQCREVLYPTQPVKRNSFPICLSNTKNGVAPELVLLRISPPPLIK